MDKYAPLKEHEIFLDIYVTKVYTKRLEPNREKKKEFPNLFNSKIYLQYSFKIAKKVLLVTKIYLKLAIIFLIY